MIKRNNQITWKRRLGLALLNGGIFTVALLFVHYLMDGEILNWFSIVFQGLFFGLFMAYGFPLIFKKMGTSLGNSIHPELASDEEIEMEGPANLFRGMEGVGGKLFLTNQKVIFKAHALNIQTGQTDISFDSITDIQFRKTGHLLDNGLSILTTDQRKYDLVLADREIWREKLRAKVKS